MSHAHSRHDCHHDCRLNYCSRCHISWSKDNLTVLQCICIWWPNTDNRGASSPITTNDHQCLTKSSCFAGSRAIGLSVYFWSGLNPATLLLTLQKLFERRSHHSKQFILTLCNFGRWVNVVSLRWCTDLILWQSQLSLEDIDDDYACCIKLEDDQQLKALKCISFYLEEEPADNVLSVILEQPPASVAMVTAIIWL